MNVLVAEDSLTMRRLLQASLEKWGYEVAAAEDGAQAWQQFQQGVFPLVLTDWLMPNMDGLELIRRIRSCDAPHYVYIILLTAKSEKEDLVTAMDTGADDFLAKPFHPDELRVRMREGKRIVRLEHSLADQNRQLRETQAALVQTEKLASLGQLAAGMAHEINNPVAYVANNLTVLNRDMRTVLELLAAYRSSAATWLPADGSCAAELAQLEQQGDLPWIEENLPRLLDSSLQGLSRVREVVTNLRDFSRLDEAERDELDLNTALQAATNVLRYEIEEKQLSLKTDFQASRRVRCEPAKMHQVFHQLLLNAIQASERQGVIELSTRSDDQRVAAAVRDHGCGIDASLLPRLFEPFFTTRQVGVGAGLGLAICHGIVRTHGGSIEVASRIGEGSTFTVVLPLRPIREE